MTLDFNFQLLSFSLILISTNFSISLTPLYTFFITTLLTFPNPKFSLFVSRLSSWAGMGGGARCKAPQKPPLSDPFPRVRPVFVPFAADTIRCAALQGNWFVIIRTAQIFANNPIDCNLSCFFFSRLDDEKFVSHNLLWLKFLVTTQSAGIRGWWWNIFDLILNMCLRFYVLLKKNAWRACFDWIERFGLITGSLILATQMWSVKFWWRWSQQNLRNWSWWTCFQLRTWGRIGAFFSLKI